MRVPTEGEREYAGRAGGTEPRYGAIDEIAWYADNSGDRRLDSQAMAEQEFYEVLKENHNFAKPVAQKKPNAWGLYDMLGNVWRFTAAQYDPKYSLIESPGPEGSAG